MINDVLGYMLPWKRQEYIMPRMMPRSWTIVHCSQALGNQCTYDYNEFCSVNIGKRSKRFQCTMWHWE